MRDPTDDASQDPTYVVLNGAAMLEADAKAAWAHIINYPSWQNYSIVQYVSGKAGQEGELLLLKKEERGASSTAYYARTVKIEPERRIIWKIFREKPAEGEATFGIVDFSVQAAEGGSLFTYRLFYEFASPQGGEDDLELFREQKQQGIKNLLAAVIPKLEALVKGGS